MYGGSVRRRGDHGGDLQVNGVAGDAFAQPEQNRRRQRRHRKESPKGPVDYRRNNEHSVAEIVYATP